MILTIYGEFFSFIRFKNLTFLFILILNIFIKIALKKFVLKLKL